MSTAKPAASSRARAVLGRTAKRMLRRVGLEVTPVGSKGVFLARRSKLSRGELRASHVSRDAFLLHNPVLSRRDWMNQHKTLCRHLVGSHIAGVLRKYQVNLVIDVGANRGQFANSLRRCRYRGHIASFEPLPADFALLSEAAAADPDWTVHNVALGREKGVLPMNVVDPGTMSSMLAPSEFGAKRFERFGSIETVEVEVRRLDEMLDSITAEVDGPRPYLKLDTQGFDLEVFSGLGDRVSELVGMQSEVALLTTYEGMPRMPKALETYEAAGFELTGLFPGGRERRTARVLEYDCIMVRADALPAG